MATVFESGPPPRASTWPWRGRSRRNSLSEGPQSAPSSPISRPGRNSLSIMDTTKVDQIRAEVAALAAAAANPTPPSPRMVRVGEREEGGADEAKYSRRSSTSNSRPPPAFWNVPYTHKNTHKRHSSAAAALHNSFVTYNDELLKPPSRFRAPTFIGPATSPAGTSQPLVPTMVMLPVTPQMPVAMYPPREQEFVQRTQRSSEKTQYVTHGGKASLGQPFYTDMPMITFVPTGRPGYPYPGMEAPTLQARSRRSSTSSSVSSANSSVSWNRESFESRIRSSSTSARTSIDSMPPHSPGAMAHVVPYCPVHHRPQAFPWQKPVSIKPRRRARPGEQFAALPGEVLEMILQELRNLHTSPRGNSCETCWMRDCCSVALSARKFLKYAREALYQHIFLHGDESPQMKKRTKLSYGCRLTLLRRTLRANMQMAVIVRSLKPPALPQGVGAVEYNDLVASVVMACPNLERLVGFYPSYNHEFQRFFHALSTRKKLKEMNWILDPAPRSNVAFQPQHMGRPNSNHHVRTPSDLQPRQAQGFLDFHANWQNLTSLVVHCHPGATLTPNLLLGRTLRCLPSLHNLHLSHLPSTSFNDSSLLSLPPLKKLTLDHLPGLSTAGLSAFATRTNSSRLTTLTLIHINVETIPALARMFSNLTSLETFNLVQKYAPILPSDELIWLFPYLASTTLRRLHWDVPYLPTRATTADSILAKSIQAGGFPALRFLRVPNDPEGIFQSLCYPTERADLPTDRYRGTQWQANHRHHNSAESGHVIHSSGWDRGHSGSHVRRNSAVGVNSSPTSPGRPSFTQDALLLPRENSNLHHARLAAQERLEAAKRFPKFFFNVINEYNVVVERFGAGAYMGTVGSPIKYVLTPDAGGTDEGGGLIGVQDMLGDCGEALILGNKTDIKKGSKREKAGESEGEGTRTREGCCGRWNVSESMAGDKKDRDRWYHVERGRWRGAALS